MKLCDRVYHLCNVLGIHGMPFSNDNELNSMALKVCRASIPSFTFRAPETRHALPGQENYDAAKAWRQC